MNNHWSKNTPISLTSEDWFNETKVRNLHIMNECTKYRLDIAKIKTCKNAENLIKKAKKIIEKKS